MAERIGVTDGKLEVTGPLLSPGHGRGYRPAQDNRRYFEGMTWIARTGAQRRHLPDEYGEWNSVFRRYGRWVTTGVFDAMLETLAELAGHDTAADMMPATGADIKLGHVEGADGQTFATAEDGGAASVVGVIKFIANPADGGAQPRRPMGRILDIGPGRKRDFIANDTALAGGLLLTQPDPEGLRARRRR